MMKRNNYKAKHQRIREATMRRILLTLLWLTVLLFVAQMVYFVFFATRPLRYSEGTPLAIERISVDAGRISYLYNDGDGVVWIGTEANGIYRYAITDGKAVPIDAPDELRHAIVRSLAVDRYGRLWAGTVRNGLFIHNDRQWRHYEIGGRIPAIRVSPVDGTVILATDAGVIGYDAEKDTWTEINPKIVQPVSLAFDAKGNLFVGTSCNGIVSLTRDDAGNFRIKKQIIAPRRFGPGSAPDVSPVPLDPCGEGLPSNQINAILVGLDGTVWAGTAAGLAWSRDDGETWAFLRGRDYGDKMRGLFAGTPHGWKELPRVRFGELLPEDHVSLLTEDASGTLWIGTATLGCIALKPASLYRNTNPKNDDWPSQRTFLEEVATESGRFHGTKTDRIVAMTVLSDTEILIASATGSLEKMECPGVKQDSPAASKPERTTPQRAFPAPYTAKTVEQPDDEAVYPNAVFLGKDRTTSEAWSGKYGRTYALIGGGEMPHDTLIAFNEDLCQVRLFVGNVGNRTRPLERVTLFHALQDGDDQPPPITGWTSAGSTVPRTADGQNLWCEVRLGLPGRYELSLYFADPLLPHDHTAEARDYLVEVFPEMPTPRVRIPRSNWQEFGRLTDEWAARTEPLTHCRIVDFRDGIYARFALTGPGTYLVKIDKNYGRKVDLCAVLIDKTGAETELPVMSLDQAPDEIPD